MEVLGAFSFPDRWAEIDEQFDYFTYKVNFQGIEVKAGKTMFHGHERIGRVICKEVTRRLKLATREQTALDTLIFWHLRPGYLADNKVLTRRAVYRYFRDTGAEAVSVLLLAVADQRATRGPLASVSNRRRHEKVAFDLTRRYFEKQKEEPFVRLINGDDLIKKLRLTPGPAFSRILTAWVNRGQSASSNLPVRILCWSMRPKDEINRMDSCSPGISIL